MKVFVALSCLLAVATASLIASPYSALLQPQHLPIIDSNGVPVEPLVNQAARVQHAQLRAAAQIRNGDLWSAPLALGAPASLALAGVSPLALAAPGALLGAPHAATILDASGVPVEPLANQIARAQNAAAHAQALHGRKRRSLISPLAVSAWAAPQHLPIIDSNGVPVEPLVNQAARVQHAQLRAAAQIRNGDGLIGAPLALAAPALAAGPLGLAGHGAILGAGPLALAGHGAILGAPLLDANSVPIEPLANQIARAQNAAAHVEANARTGNLAIHGRKKRSLISPLGLASPAAIWAAPQHLPIIDSNGVPVEPLVNQAARVQHAQLRAAAQIRNGDVGLIGSPLALAGASPLGLAAPLGLASISHAGRVPLDTPDLVAVRAAHLATKTGLLW